MADNAQEADNANNSANNNSASNRSAHKASDRSRNQQPQDPSRRNLLKSAGIVGAAAVGGGTSGAVIAQEPAAAEQSQNPVVREALEVLTASEAALLEAICDRLIPSDQNGPGAREARAVHYIDRSLASHNQQLRQDYMVSLAAIDDYARQTRSMPFGELDRDQQESILEALQAGEVPGCSPGSSGFFNMLRNHTIEGTFSDPYYGGNRDFVGWDMLRYPGIRLSASETDVARGAALAPNHQSAYDHDTYTKMAGNMAQGGGGGRDNA